MILDISILFLFSLVFLVLSIIYEKSKYELKLKEQIVRPSQTRYQDLLRLINTLLEQGELKMHAIDDSDYYGSIYGKLVKRVTQIKTIQKGKELYYESASHLLLI